MKTKSSLPNSIKSWQVREIFHPSLINILHIYNIYMYKYIYLTYTSSIGLVILPLDMETNESLDPTIL